MPIDIPHLDQYFGFWCMDERSFWSQFELFKSADLHMHFASDAPAAAVERAHVGPSVANQIAVVEISGKMMKQSSSMGGGTSTVAARRMIRNLARDNEIAAIMLKIDSPGGTVAGTADLADEIAAAGKRKPVHAYVEDLAASAAYWAASQAGSISSSASSLVGSIGTFAVVYDTSGAAAMDGIKAYVIRAGSHKGTGTPGTEITPEQLTEMQRIVDGLNAHFLEGVSAGRKMKIDQVKSIADGRVHVAGDAKNIGLVDHVESFDAAIQRLQATVQKQQSRSRANMATEITIQSTNDTITATPQAATFNELKAVLVGADATFMVAQLDAHATVTQATAAWMAEQNRRIEAARSEASQLAVQRAGVQPIATANVITQSDESALVEFNRLVAEKESLGFNKTKAASLVVAANPDLHQRVIEEANAGRKRRR